MDAHRDVLCEVGVEELPHETIPAIVAEYLKLFKGNLETYRILYEGIEAFSTPRRLAVLIRGVSGKQKDFESEKRGPSIAKAYDQHGKPTSALLGFCKAQGIEEKNLITKKLKGGEYLFAVKKIEGKPTEHILPKILLHVLSSLHFTKSMRWEQTGFSFIRPIRWIVYLFGHEVVPFEVAGVFSGRYTYGHRAYAKMPISIDVPANYEGLLREAKVIAKRELRMEQCREGIDSLLKKTGLTVHPDAEVLYKINTDLTELPVPVLCSFEAHFLELPVEVLVSEMIEHQHYFPLISKVDGLLTNQFIAISNISDNSLTRYGYERVLHARLDDGKFFFEEDKEVEFSRLVEKLTSVSFHEKLGSMKNKVDRIQKIAAELASMLDLDEELRTRIDTVAMLCKNDLSTLMVNEFPNLQGIMGYYYALASGYPEQVALGIKEHYLPRSARDALPEELEGALVGIADRLDTIVGIFSTGYLPKGSKDPYGLRRSMFGIIKIIVKHKLNFSQEKLIKKIIPLYPEVVDKTVLLSTINDFFKSRIKHVFSEMGFTYDEIDASLANVLEGIYDVYRRVSALHRVRGEKTFQNLLISFKRMANIVKDEKDSTFSEELLIEKQEKALYFFYKSQYERIIEAINNRDYKTVYTILGEFKPYVDEFFDSVLVMDPDEKLRGNRVTLLKKIVNSFSKIIDFSKIVVPME